MNLTDDEIEQLLKILNREDSLIQAPRKIQARNRINGVFAVVLTDGMWLCNWCAGIPYHKKDVVISEQTKLGVRINQRRYCPSCYTKLDEE